MILETRELAPQFGEAVLAARVGGCGMSLCGGARIHGVASLVVPLLVRPARYRPRKAVVRHYALVVQKGAVRVDWT